MIVTRSGIAYISLVNNNTQTPTPASTQWSGLPEGFTYRGEAPVAATNYNYGHFVFDPDTDNVYVFTSTINASVTRADIPTHANFVPLVNVLSDAEAVDDTSHVYGSVSGSQIADAIAAHAGSGTFVAANPSGTPTDQLKTVTIGSTVLQVRSTFSVKYLSDRPVADEDTVGLVYHVLQAGQAYFGVEDSHQSTTPSGSFNNVPNRSDLHIVATLPTNLNNLSTGDFYYHAGGDPARGGYEFYEVVVRGTKQLQNVHASRALAASRSNNSFSVAWLGSEADSTEALAFTDSISSTTNYFFHNETTDTIQRLVNSSYTGPTVEPHYRWLAIGGGGGTEDGIADSLAFAVSGQDVTATLGRSVGADLTATFTVPGGGSGDDAFDWATVGNTDLVPTAKLGPGVANADRILRGSRTWGRINANMLTASFVDDDPPDEADYMLFADSGPGRLLSFRTYGSLLDGIASDIKTVTALPDPEDVDDADKDKLWLVVPTVDTGVDEVAHFKPAGDTTVFTMTAADHTYGSGLHLVGTDKADRLGHLEPKTNLHDIYWEDTLDTYYIEFQDGSTSPFDYSNYTNGLSLYFREQGTTGNWRRVFLAQQSDDNEFSSAEGVANHFVGGTVYDVIVRSGTSTTAGVHSVSSVPSTLRLEPHPGGGSFRSLVDEDELGQITTVTQEVRQVDGEVNDFTLAYASGTLTGTVERSIGADIVATAAIPEGLPLAGGTLTGDLIVDGAVAIERGATSGIALSITKTDTGGNPVVRMIHPDNTGNGQRPFNARRDGESDYFEVNGRLGGTNDNPGIAFGTGSGARDARLWRGGANLLESDDALQVDELRIGGTVATTRTNLGLGTAATEDTGTASGDIAVLGTGGAFAPARLGSGTRNSSTVLHGDGAFKTALWTYE